MSYSIAAKGSAKDIFRSFGTFDRAVFQSYPDGPSPEVVDHLFFAKQAIAEALASGIFGNPEGEFSVNVSGHANPGHEPVANWSNDSIYILITQIKSATEPESKPLDTDGVLIN